MRRWRNVSETLRFLRHPAALALTVLLAGQAAAFYLLPKNENAPPAPAMKAFPAQLGSWRVIGEFPLEDEVSKVLRADDTLNRVYASLDYPVNLSLFMAYFRSQKSGVAPHSPKNCLPGSGWAPLSSEVVDLALPGRPEKLQVNRFIVARGTDKTLVLYWYQTAHRAIASEYEAKIWLVLDSLRYRRSDTAIVRVVAPLPEAGRDQIEKATAEFIAAAYPYVRAQIPK